MHCIDIDRRRERFFASICCFFMLKFILLWSKVIHYRYQYISVSIKFLNKWNTKDPTLISMWQLKLITSLPLKFLYEISPLLFYSWKLTKFLIEIYKFCKNMRDFGNFQISLLIKDIIICILIQALTKILKLIQIHNTTNGMHLIITVNHSMLTFISSY